MWANRKSCLQNLERVETEEADSLHPTISGFDDRTLLNSVVPLSILHHGDLGKFQWNRSGRGFQNPYLQIGDDWHCSPSANTRGVATFDASQVDADLCR